MSNVKPYIYVVDIFKTLNRKLKRNLLPKDTGFYGQNLRFDEEYASIEKRKTRAKYNSSPISSAPIISLHRYYKNSTNSAALLAVMDSAIRIGYDGAGVFSDLKTGIKSIPWSFHTFKDNVYMVNGSDTNVVFNLSTKLTYVQNMGVPSITTGGASVKASAGNLLGNPLYYAITQQIDGYQEGSRTPSWTSGDINGSQCTISWTISTNSRCTGYYLYRTKSSASTLYRVATVAGVGTPSYIDNIADTSLDTTIVAPIDYGVPDSYKFICLHKERLFLARNKTYKSRIIYSDIRSELSYPDVFPSKNYLRIAEDDGDEITFVKNDHLGQLIVSKYNSIRIIYTTADSDLTWSISDSYSSQGCIAPYSAQTISGGILYLARFGETKKRLVLWTGAGVKVIPELEGLEPILTNIPETALDEIRGHFHNGYYYLAYRDKSQTYNDKVLVINTLDWSWAIDKKNVASFCSWIGGSDFGELYTGSSDNSGYIYHEDINDFDFILKYKSEIDWGTHSYTSSAGGETTPSVILGTGISTQIGAQKWSTLSNATNTWADYVLWVDSWWLTGQWIDQIRDLSTKVLSALYWHESQGGNTDVAMWIRTGESEALCNAAGWSGPYFNSGDDLSSISASRYIQIKAQLLVRDYADRASAILYREGTGDNDYFIKLSANRGSPAETTIEFDWQSGRFDGGDLNEALKRVRKRLHSVKIEYVRSDTTTGNFDFEWYFNGSTTAVNSFNTSFATYPNRRIYNFAPKDAFFEDFWYRIYSNSDRNDLKIKKVIFVVSAEPYFSKL